MIASLPLKTNDIPMKIKNLLLAFITVLAINSAFAQSKLPSADEILNGAIKEAKAQNKKVFIMFHASWCGWCHKMDDSMNEPEMKPLFDKSFVIKHITVMEYDAKKKLDENPGGMDMIKKYNSDGFGIPLWFIFDTNGKLLVDSHMRPEGTGFETKGKQIVGCPAAKEEVDEFVRALKLTTKLTKAELEKIYTQFRKNDPNYKG